MGPHDYPIPLTSLDTRGIRVVVRIMSSPFGRLASILTQVPVSLEHGTVAIASIQVVGPSL